MLLDHSPCVDRRLPGLALVCVLSATVAVGQGTDTDAISQEQVSGAEESAGSDTSGVALRFDEVVVVTASRTEQRLSEVPAAMTVLGGEQLQQMPSDNFGDLLRNVPGLNVSQTSGWDVSVASRNASSVLPRGQLVLVDNRIVYKDFNGVVWWNAIPFNPEEVRQIEALRGPASAVWGANAVDGVINIITKTPRQMAGTTMTFGGGELATRHASATHAAVRGKLGYKISGSWYQQDPYDRPTGTIPGTDGTLESGRNAVSRVREPADGDPEVQLPGRLRSGRVDDLVRQRRLRGHQRCHSDPRRPG